MRYLIKLAAVAAILLAPTAASAVVVYSNDFESGVLGPEWSGAGSIQGTQGYSGIAGFGNFFLRNDSIGNPAAASILTLTGLPAHTHMVIGRLLAIIDSWDGNGPSGGGADFLVGKVNGVIGVATTFSNFDVTNDTTLAAPISFGTDLGFTGWNDSAYDFTGGAPGFFAHTASTLVLEIFTAGAGWEGGDDESWAIDGLTVHVECRGCDESPPVTGVPEPMTLSLLGAGLAGIGAMRRRRS